MALDVTHGNRYYEHVMSSLIDLTAKRKKMEENFDRSMRRDYDHICDSQMKNVAELLKLGVECEENDGIINLLASDGNILEFQKEEVIEVVGQDQYNIMFPPVEEEKNKDDWFELEKSPHEEYHYHQPNMQMNVSNDLLQAIGVNNNPLASILAPLLNNALYSAQQQQYRNPSYGKFYDAEAMEKVEEMRKEREVALKKGRQLKHSYEELKEDYEELMEKYEALRNSSNEKANQLQTELNRLLLQIQDEKEKALNISATYNEKENQLKAYYESQLNNCKTKINDYEQQIDTYSKTLHQRDLEIDNLKAELEGLRKINQTIENNLLEVNEKLQQSISENETFMEENQNLRNEFEQKQENMLSEVTQMEAQMKEMNNINIDMTEKYSKVCDDIQKKDEELKELNESVQKEKEMIKNLQAKLEHANKNNEQKTEQNRNLEKQLSELRENSKKNQNSNNAKEKELVAKKRECDELKDQCVSLQREIDKLRNEKVAIEEMKNVADTERSQLKEHQDALQDELSILKETNETLIGNLSLMEEVAYFDTKFNIGNYKKFNRDIYDKNNDIIIIALVDICNMKKINSEYKEETGDSVIKTTIQELQKEFGEENIYRLQGGQFAVTADTSYEAVSSELSEIQSNLWSNMEFHIAFGVCNLKKHGPEEAMKKAKKAMRAMGKAITSQREQKEYNNQIFASVMQQVPQQQMAQQQMAQQQMAQQQMVAIQQTGGYLQQEPYRNPNVNLPVPEEYEEPEIIREVDMTSMNLVNDIMNMRK